MAGQRRRPHKSAAAVAEHLSTIPAIREVVPHDPSLSARWHRHGVPSPFSRWNYHPEYEVHLIRSGTGRYIIGDTIDVFSAGQLTLIGSNQPHHWISDLSPGEVIQDRDIVFQFHPDWIARCQPLLPELSQLNTLLKRSARGIEFLEETARQGAHELQAIGETTGPERLGHIFGLLGVLSSAPAGEHRTIAQAWLPPLDDDYAAAIIDRALTYILDNLTGDVRLSAAADLIGMSESAFSRYFKRVSGQTFSDTVRRLRLAEAGKLLRDSDLPIGSIYHRVGFANLSNFNRQFKKRYDLTPREYRQAQNARSVG